MADPNQIRSRYEFRWEVIDVILGGKSIVDSRMGFTGLPMHNHDDVSRFMASYGYDVGDPIEAAEVFGNFHEALAFIRTHFLKPENPEGLALEVPRKILEISDIRDLLLMAAQGYPGQMADTAGFMLRDWACAILKCMHAIAHIDKDLRTPYYSDIQKQIMDRFYKVVHRDDNERLTLGEGEDTIDLVAFETKPRKTRHSLLLKMLHKPEAVPDEVFDQVGIRFVTTNVLDTLRVVKFLKDAMIVVPANIKPSRSRNTLVDINHFKEALDPLLQQVQEGSITEGELKGELNEAAFPSEESKNPHSSEHYRALQFTARQLIKLRNPLFDNLKKLQTMAKADETAQNLPPEFASTVDQIDLKYVQREIRFFYPFEVQIMDVESSKQNEVGLSAHSEYKRAQVKTAMTRVMGNLADGQLG